MFTTHYITPVVSVHTSDTSLYMIEKEKNQQHMSRAGNHYRSHGQAVRASSFVLTECSHMYEPIEDEIGRAPNIGTGLIFTEIDFEFKFKDHAVSFNLISFYCLVLMTLVMWHDSSSSDYAKIYQQEKCYCKPTFVQFYTLLARDTESLYGDPKSLTRPLEVSESLKSAVSL